MPSRRSAGRDLARMLHLMDQEDRLRMLVAYALLKTKRVPKTVSADDLEDAVWAAMTKWRKARGSSQP